MAQENLTEFITRALATLVGVVVGFGLAWLRQKSDERRDRIERFKTALFILIQQRVFLRNLEAQSLRPHHQSPIRAYAIQPILAAPPASAFDVKPLAFLLTSGDAELVNHLALAEAKYQSIIVLLEARNKVHYAFQEKLSTSSYAKAGSEGTLEDIRTVAGLAMARQLEQMTDDLINNVDDAIVFNQHTLERAFGAFKKRILGLATLELRISRLLNPLITQANGVAAQRSVPT